LGHQNSAWFWRAPKVQERWFGVTDKVKIFSTVSGASSFLIRTFPRLSLPNQRKLQSIFDPWRDSVLSLKNVYQGGEQG
jgi:hypothetical protein